MLRAPPRPGLRRHPPGGAHADPISRSQPVNASDDEASGTLLDLLEKRGADLGIEIRMPTRPLDGWRVEAELIPGGGVVLYLRSGATTSAVTEVLMQQHPDLVLESVGPGRTPDERALAFAPVAPNPRPTVVESSLPSQNGTAS